ncbi:MAG TPA: hypothetical protein VH251_06925, partial [Verrucomicrobiae bacterium]|nr:hypothetical protein [Verrucomicrobiae bacterium]
PRVTQNPKRNVGAAKAVLAGETRIPKLAGERTRPGCHFPRPRGKFRAHRNLPSVLGMSRATAERGTDVLPGTEEARTE